MFRIALALLLAATPAAAEVFDSSAGPVEVRKVVGGLDRPWAVAFLPDGAKLITEKGGDLIHVAADGAKLPVAGVPAVDDSGQGGLLDVVADSGFAENRTIFLSYAEPVDGGARTAVARARLGPAGDRLEEVSVIFRQSPVTRSAKHFGSRIVEARDGTLFVTVGERGERPMAQDPQAHHGSVVRIAKDGSVPDDNPFADGPALPEIWSTGHRNPQGAALDPETGALWTVEHGARGGDEVNRPRPGRNYGWPVISYGRHYSGGKIGEGTQKPGMEQPLHYWDPSIAPSGLVVYSGRLWPEWRGDLFVGALKFQLLSRLDRQGDRIAGEERLFRGRFGRIRDVREGPDGALWFLTDSRDGGLYRMTPAERGDAG